MSELGVAVDWSLAFRLTKRARSAVLADAGRWLGGSGKMADAMSRPTTGARDLLQASVLYIVASVRLDSTIFNAQQHRSLGLAVPTAPCVLVTNIHDSPGVEESG